MFLLNVVWFPRSFQDIIYGKGPWAQRRDNHFLCFPQYYFTDAIAVTNLRGLQSKVRIHFF